MPGFTDEQKKIALLLLNEPKTEEELNKQLNIPYDKLVLELKTMLKVGVLLKEGYPTKYRLKQDIIDEVKKRKKISEEDAFRIRIRAIIEFSAVEETLLMKHIEKIKTAIAKEDKYFTVYSLDISASEEKDEMYNAFLEVNISVRDFPSLIRFMYYYGPSSIEILKPTKLEFTQYEFQEGLVELADIFQNYAHYFAEKMTKEELDKFMKKVYS